MSDRNNNIVIIDPAINKPVCESFNSIPLIANNKSICHMPALFGTENLNTIENMKCLIILGNAASVHHNSNWQPEIVKVLEYAIKKRIPVLGICYGHQLIAYIYDGIIKNLWAGEGKKGIQKVHLFQKLFNNISDEINLIYTHNEGITDGPIDGIISNKKLIYGFQPHIEATKPFFVEESIITNQDNVILNTNKELLLKFLSLVK